ncbi:MAG: Calx-beta domain-containing protein [Candidatus Paceibacterota bacterium]
MADGTWYVRLKATDAAGNESTSGTFTVVVDATAPRISNITTPLSAYGNYIIDDNVGIRVQFSEEVTSSGSIVLTMDTGGTCTISAISVATNTADCTYTVSELEESNQLTVSNISGSITDEAGNAMINFTPITNLAANGVIVVDGIKPTLSSVTLTSQGSNPMYAKVGDVVRLTFTMSEMSNFSPGPTVSFYVNGTPANNVSNSGVATNLGGFNWKSEFTASSNDANGNVTYSISFGDYPGNAGDNVNSGEGSVLFDKTAPSAASDISPTVGTGNVFQFVTNYDLTWTAGSDSGANASGLANPAYTIYSYSTQNACNVTHTGGDVLGTSDVNSFSTSDNPLDSSALNPGDNWIGVMITDNAGNSNYACSGALINVDSIAPTVPGTPSTTSTPLSDSDPTWSWDASTDTESNMVGATYSVQWASDSLFTQNVGNGTSSTNSYTHQSTLANGAWYFRVKAIDRALNESAYSSYGSVLIDVNAPTLAMTAFCSIPGNGCTSAGQSATPQQIYSMRSVAGTSADTGGSNVDTVEISIQDLGVGGSSNGNYYNGSDFSSTTESWNTATGTTTWSYSTSSVPFEIGRTYKIRAKSTDGASNTSTISDISFVSTNAPPVVSNLSTPSQHASDGTISLSYKATDIESDNLSISLFYDSGILVPSGGINSSAVSMTVSSGALFPSTGYILIDNEIIEYTKSGNVLSLTRGAGVNYLISGLTSTDNQATPASHSQNTKIYIYAPSVSGDYGYQAKSLNDTPPADKSIVWDARTDASGMENSAMTIRLLADDGATGEMVHYVESSSFNFDQKAPSATVTVEAGTAGGSDAIVTIPMPVDISTVEYRISDHTSNTPQTTGSWTSITGDTTASWGFDAGFEAKDLNYEFRDSYGNVTGPVLISTPAPVTSGSLTIQDVSNVATSYYAMYIGWADSNEVGAYKLQRASSSDNITYEESYSVVDTSGGLSTDNNGNYHFLDVGLDTTKHYKYKLSVVSGSNISVNVQTHVKPNGVQDYGEGGGGSVATAPKVENVVPSQNTTTKVVSVSYLLTDPSASTKNSPEYEAVVMYNIGVVTTGALSSGNLPVSDVSRFKSGGGYIQLNNEVLQYTGKNSNSLTGIVRATWPTSPRVTRQNSTIFTGTPVWIMATDSLVSVVDSSIATSGYSGSITWNAQNDVDLAGGSYSNTGIRVLVHDNQAADSGPLSSQSDYSEDGTLDPLVLTAPTVTFDSLTGTSAEATPVVPVNVGMTLSRAYPLDISFPYTVTGSADATTDYTMAQTGSSAGTVTFEAGDTTLVAPLAISVVDDAIQDNGETIILNVDPTKITSGGNASYTNTITDNDDAPAIGFTVTDNSSVNENANSGVIPIRLSIVGASSSPITATYTVTGTATSGTDFTALSGSAVIPAGELYTDITLNITGDTGYEQNETVILTINSAPGATLTTGVDDVYTHTITNDDTIPAITFDSPLFSNGAETVDTVGIPVTLTNASYQDVRVNYTADASSTAPVEDYDLGAGFITIPAGQTTGVITLGVNNNPNVLGSRTVVLVLSPDNVEIASASSPTNTYTYTIDADISATVSFDENALSLSDTEDTAGTIDIPVYISAQSGTDTVVTYTLTGGATAGTDYTAPNPLSVTIPANTDSALIQIPITADTTDEDPETIVVTLSAVSSGMATVALTNKIYTYTINDDDDAPAIGFTTDNDSSLESDTPAAKTIDVSLLPASGKSVTVAYTITTDGTATLNSDFTATNTTGTLTIAPGSTNASIPFTVTNDDNSEAGETIIVTLANPNNATLGTSTFIYTIYNDDIENVAPTIVLTDSDSIEVVLNSGSYTDAGATIEDSGSACTSVSSFSTTITDCEYIRTGTVNTNALGTYTYTYTAKDSGGLSTIKSRTVNVVLAASYTVTVTVGANGAVDADATTQALTGYSASNSVYTIPRASATTGNDATFTITPADGYSIDLLTVGGETRANNSTSVSFTDIQENKTINVSFTATLDTTAPEITLLGDPEVDVVLGEEYIDDGITAVEDNDVSCTEGDTTTAPQNGCLWSKSGAVNVNAVGEYKIIYKAISAGGISTAERIVNVDYADTYNLTLTITGPGTVKDANGDTISAGNVVVDKLSTPAYTFVPDTDLHKVKTLSVTIGDTITPLNVDDYQAGYTFSQIKGDVSMAVGFGLIDEPLPAITFSSNPLVLAPGAPYPTDDWSATYSADGITSINLITNGQPVTDVPGVTYTISSNSSTAGVSGGDVIYTVTYTEGIGGTVTGTATRTVEDSAPPTISNISTPVIKSDVVMVSWNTNERSNTQVYWSTNTFEKNEEGLVTEDILGDPNNGYSSSALRDDSDKQATHWALMDSLTATTTYYYVVVSEDGSGNIAISPEQEVETVAAGQVIVVNSGGGGGSSGVALSVYEALQKELAELKKNNMFGITTLPVISNIKVSDVTAFGATVTFDTDRLTVAGVDYGKTKDFGKTEGNFKWSTNHKINIGGLTVGTDYYYGIAVVDKYSNVAVSIGDKQVFKTKFFSENLDEINKIENVEQFQNEIESSIESILPSLVPPFVEAPVVTDITEDSAVITYKTNIKGFSLVGYATDDYYDETKDNPYNGEVSDTTSKVTIHKVKLINLKSNTKYHFSAKAFSLPQIVGKSKDFTFITKASKIKVSVTNLTKNSFTVSWSTNSKTSSIVEYKNLKTGKVNKRTDDIRSTGHVVKIENLDPGTLYQVDVSGLNDIGNTVESAGTITIKTSTDVTAPAISKVKVDSSLVVGRNDKTQTIISWKTDEPSTSVVYYEEGSGSPDKPLANKQEDTELTLNHVVILTTLKPGTVYRFQVASSDDAKNVKKLPIRTIITPRPSESIVDVIFKNFNESFNFINNVK